MEIIQVSVDKSVDKEIIVYMYNGILFSLYKEGKPTICNIMDGTDGHHAKWNTPVTKG